MKKIKVGIAGFGIVGKKRYSCLKNDKQFEVIGICDKENSNLSSKLIGKVKKFKNYIDLFSLNLDAILICLSNDMAAEVTIAALNKNIHVFCEKPPAVNLSQMHKIIRLKNKKINVKLMYGFNHRFHDSIQEALKIIKSKKLGYIINLKGTYGKSKLITFDQTNWRTDRNIAGGGILLDQGIHLIDLIRLFGGDVLDVKSFILNNFWKHNVEDNAYAILKHKKNVVSMIHSSATQWKHKFILEINLTKGSLILEGILSSSKSYGEEKLKIIKHNPKLKYNNFKSKIINYKNDPSWSRELSNFGKAINRNKSIYSNVYDAYKTFKIVFDIYCADINWKNKYNIKN